MKKLVFFLIYSGVMLAFGGSLGYRYGVLKSGHAAIVENAAGNPAAADADDGKPMLVVPYKAVLAAGDASIPNFDNAVDVLTHRLVKVGAQTFSLSSDAHRLKTGVDQRGMAASWVIDQDFASMAPRTGEGCLVFVTSHGNEYGLLMSLDNAEHFYLTPWGLADILDADCGDSRRLPSFQAVIPAPS